MTVEEQPRDTGYESCSGIHAEMNAVMHADPYELPGATLFCTRKPCPGCQTFITAAGIARVVTPEGEMK